MTGKQDKTAIGLPFRLPPHPNPHTPDKDGKVVENIFANFHNTQKASAENVVAEFKSRLNKRNAAINMI
jgi:hypothetical protein